MRRIARALALVSPLAAALGCAGEPAATPVDAQVHATSRSNLLLVVVDTLRRDHVGCYGASRDTTPSIDRVAATGVRFERAYATAPWTMPSVASMLTGLYPGRHTANNFDRQLPDDVDTLAEILGRAGYATAGVVSHTAVGTRHNFQQGFDVYIESEARGHEHVSTPGVTRQAVEQLEQLSADPRPFFLFAHYFDPHYTYRDHEGIDWAPARAGRYHAGMTMQQLRAVNDPTGEELDLVRALYDEEIRFTDAGIGRLLARLAELGHADDTLVVITSDHGEEFADHGQFGHTRTLYEELVSVPLVLRLPGPERPAAVRGQPVSLVGLTPTVLDLLGVPVDRLVFQAGSWGRGDEPPDDTRSSSVFFEVDFDPVRPGRSLEPVHKKAVLAGWNKLVLDEGLGRVELYDLAADPRERHDRSAAAPGRVQALRAMLDEVWARAHSRPLPPRDVTLDEAEIERLRALGYVGD